jgi:hypothetical protein
MKPKKRTARCYVFSCRRPVLRDGLCAAHHQRVKRTGSVKALTPIAKPRGRAAPRKAWRAS